MIIYADPSTYPAAGKNTGQIQQVGGSKIDFCKSIFLGTSSYAENSISFFSKPVLNHHW